MKICQRLFVFTDVRVYRIACDCHHPGESHTRICLYHRRLEDDKSQKADDMFLEYILAKNEKLPGYIAWKCLLNTKQTPLLSQKRLFLSQSFLDSMSNVGAGSFESPPQYCVWADLGVPWYVSIFYGITNKPLSTKLIPGVSFCCMDCCQILRRKTIGLKTFKTPEPDFYQKARENSIRSMTDASYDYMRGNDFWEVSKCILLQEI